MMSKQYTAAFKAKVVQELLKEEKTLVQITSEFEVHPTQLKNGRAIALAGLPSLFEKQDSTAELKAAYEQQQTELYAEIGKLTTQVTWLKKVTPLSREERLTYIEREGNDLPLSIQAELVSISRSSLYYQPRPPSDEEVKIKHRIDELYTDYPFYGSRRMIAQLRREGMDIHRNAVQRHMREMGIEAIYPGPNLRRRHLKDQVYPYLLRRLTITGPNHLCGIDITYIHMQRGWMYLVAILDWYSRYVVSGELDLTLKRPFVISAVQRALTQAVPNHRGFIVHLLFSLQWCRKEGCQTTTVLEILSFHSPVCHVLTLSF